MHSNINNVASGQVTYAQSREARWPSGRASDSGARGRGSILNRVAMLYTLS